MLCKQNFIERPSNLNAQREKEYILRRKGAGEVLTEVELLVLAAMKERPDYGKGGLVAVFSGSPLSRAWHDFMIERSRVIRQCKGKEPGFQAEVDMSKIYNDLIGEEDVLDMFSKVAKVAQLPDKQIHWVQYVTPEGLVLSKEDFIKRYNRD